MTYTLHAKIDHGRLVVEEPLPAELGEGPVRIVVESLSAADQDDLAAFEAAARKSFSEPANSPDNLIDWETAFENK